MTASMRDRVTRHLRRDILQLLSEAEGYDLSLPILRDSVAMVGHRPGGDAVRTQLAWLEEQGLVTVEEVGSITVATLTERGRDVARGGPRVPGVAPREPGAARPDPE